jgi:thioesterase domain-containing protein
LEPIDDEPLWTRELAAELRSYLRRKLPEYMTPAVFVPLAALPRTPNGKTDRKALPTPKLERVARMGECVLPRNATERKLHDLWTRLLGVRDFGVEDNFFEIGGTSLLAVRMISQAHELFGVYVSLAAMIENPTIAHLAKAVDDPDSKRPSNPVVTFKHGKGGKPIFVFWGEDGAVLWAYELARHIRDDAPVYGIEGPGYEGGPAIDNMYRLAAYAVEHIRRVQPSGPYQMVGWCFGGLIAHEAARILTEAGETVEFIGMIDTPYPHEWASLPGRLRKFTLEKVLPPVLLMVRRFRAFWNLSLRDKLYYGRQMAARFVSSRPHEDRAPFDPTAEWTPIIRHRETVVVPAQKRALRTYVPSPISVRIDLYMAHERALEFSQEPYWGWRRNGLHDVRLHVIPGDHGTCFRGANAAAMADPIERSMNGAVAAVPAAAD